MISLKKKKGKTKTGAREYRKFLCKVTTENLLGENKGFKYYENVAALEIRESCAIKNVSSNA